SEFIAKVEAGPGRAAGLLKQVEQSEQKHRNDHPHGEVAEITHGQYILSGMCRDGLYKQHCHPDRKSRLNLT
ncbi:MAG: hypothetical protein AAFW74_07890, partial [Pseudomonadota bacterium]